MNIVNRIEPSAKSHLVNQNNKAFYQGHMGLLFNFSRNGHHHSGTVVYKNDQWVFVENLGHRWEKPTFKFLESCERRPWIVINGTIDLLSRVRFSEPILEILKSEPIAIYLFEPILFFKSDLDRNAWRANSSSDISFFCLELESILYFRECIGHANITIYTCDHGLSDAIKEHPRYHSLKIKTFDLFLAHCGQEISQREGSALAPIDFTKTSICLNYRYDYFREIMVAFLRARNYHQRSILTYYHRHDSQNFQYLPFDFNSWPPAQLVREGIKKMEHEIPYLIDSKNAEAFCPIREVVPDMRAGPSHRDDSHLRMFYENSFCAIVNETRFFTYFPNLSEKTFTPLFFGRPIVLTAPPKSLAYLKELGFQTFSSFWDETYDEEMGHERRLERLFSLIDQIFSQSESKLRSLLWDMQPVLTHNRARFLSLPDSMRAFIRSEA